MLAFRVKCRICRSLFGGPKVAIGGVIVTLRFGLLLLVPRRAYSDARGRRHSAVLLHVWGKTLQS